jgi:dethiobiotin synthetase
LKGLFITGTDTGVGKTYIGSALVRTLSARGHRLRVRKPVESGCAPSASGPEPADAIALHEAAGRVEPLDSVCPIRLQAALSPPRAARLEGRPLSLSELTASCQRGLGPQDLLIVEGAGGFYSPIAEDGLNADLAQRLGLPLVLVIGDRLGCINHTLLTLEAARRRGLSIAALVLSRPGSPDEASMDNLQDLSELLSDPIVAFPHDPERTRGDAAAAQLCQVLESSLGRGGD